MGKGMSQSLSIRAMSFDDDMTNPSAGGNRSQSLSIRAMSFDGELGLIQATAKSLNPFRSGQCLSTLSYQKKQSMVLCLNPFRSGQCLSTTLTLRDLAQSTMSQSLSIRAMSFDCSGMLEAGIMRPFRPTSQFFWKVKELALDLSK